MVQEKSSGKVHFDECLTLVRIMMFQTIPAQWHQFTLSAKTIVGRMTSMEENLVAGAVDLPAHCVGRFVAIHTTYLRVPIRTNDGRQFSQYQFTGFYVLYRYHISVRRRKVTSYHLRSAQRNENKRRLTYLPNFSFVFNSHFLNRKFFMIREFCT